MSILVASGTHLLTGGEVTFVTYATTPALNNPGVFVLIVDVGLASAGDKYVFKAYSIAHDTPGSGVIYAPTEVEYNAIPGDIWASDPVISPASLYWTIKQTAGSAYLVGWAIMKVS